MTNHQSKKSFNKIYYYLLIIFLFPVLLNFILFSFDLGISYGDGNVWLAFWGNYSGGVISALVAYFVANSQIKKQKEIDLSRLQYESATKQLPALIRIRFELEKCIEELIKIEDERNDLVEFSGGIRDESEVDPPNVDDLPQYKKPLGIKDSELKKQHYRIELVDPEVFKYLEKVEDVDLHIDLINNFNYYKDFSTALTFNSHLADKEQNLLLELLYAGRSTIEGEKQFSDLSRELHKTNLKKAKGWETYFNENKLEAFNETLKHLNEEIERVSLIKKNGIA